MLLTLYMPWVPVAYAVLILPLASMWGSSLRVLTGFSCPLFTLIPSYSVCSLGP